MCLKIIVTVIISTTTLFKKVISVLELNSYYQVTQKYLQEVTLPQVLVPACVIALGSTEQCAG